MKIIAFNGSPRKGGNTSYSIQKAFEPLIAAGHDCEEIKVGGVHVHGCKACYACRSEKSLGICIQKDDPINEWAQKMREADAIILASPTYYANMTSELKALIDRCGLCTAGQLKYKVGAPIVVARRGGDQNVYNTLMAFFGISQMIVPMSSYWNNVFARDKGEAENDAEGMQIMENIGKNMAWLLDKLA